MEIVNRKSTIDNRKAGIRVIGMLGLSILIAALTALTTYAVQYFRLAATYEDFLSAPARRASNTRFALEVYDRFNAQTGTAKKDFGRLHTYAQKARKADGPLTAIVPGGVKEKITEMAGAAGRYFPIAFFKSLLDYLKIRSRRDALIIGGAVLAVLFLLLLATKLWIFLVTRILKLVLIVGGVAWLITLGLYLWPKKAERQEAHEISLARLEVTMLDIALREYQLEKGKYPPAGNENLLSCLGDRPEGATSRREYFDFKVATMRGGAMLDPWGSPYRYGPPGRAASDVTIGFELYSIGPNRRDERGLGDDITTEPRAFGCRFNSKLPSPS